MRLADLMDLEPVERVTRLWRRLIPLGERNFEAFPPPVKTFFAVYEWLGEVSNGGVHQYFSNSSGDRAGDLRTALGALGDADALDLFKRTLGVFGGEPPPRDRGDRVERLNQLSAEENALFDDLGGKINDASSRIHLALAELASREAAAFRFLDRYPGGYKALPIPEDLRPDPAWSHYEEVTYAYAALWDATTPAARDFLDVFAWADEVSVSGFRTWFFSRDADRHPRVLELLDQRGPAAAAHLLREALAAFPAPLDLAERRKALDALGPDAQETLASLSRDFQKVRGAVTTALARSLGAVGR